MSYDDVLVDVQDRVGWITINPEQKHNSIPQQIFRDLGDAFVALERNDAVRVVHWQR